MPAIQDPNLGLYHSWDLGEIGWNTGMDANMKLLGALVMPYANSAIVSAQPGSPNEGDRYLLGSSPSGIDWSGNLNTLALFSESVWTFISPKEGWQFKTLDTNQEYTFKDGIWSETIRRNLTLNGVNDVHIDVDSPAPGLNIKVGSTSSVFNIDENVWGTDKSGTVNNAFTVNGAFSNSSVIPASFDDIDVSGDASFGSTITDVVDIAGMLNVGANVTIDGENLIAGGATTTRIMRPNATGSLVLAGGGDNFATRQAYIQFYGGSHATKPKSAEFYADNGWFFKSGTVQIETALINTKAIPATSTSTGIAGEIRWGTSYIYVCTATNTWKRIPATLVTF